jgi:hypothetical protein
MCFGAGEGTSILANESLIKSTSSDFQEKKKKKKKRNVRYCFPPNDEFGDVL